MTTPVVFANAATSAARIYWENPNLNLIGAVEQKTNEIKVPVAITANPFVRQRRGTRTWHSERSQSSRGQPGVAPWSAESRSAGSQRRTSRRW
jgi:hypothetical protein